MFDNKNSFKVIYLHEHFIHKKGGICFAFRIHFLKYFPRIFRKLLKSIFKLFLKLKNIKSTND